MTGAAQFAGLLIQTATVYRRVQVAGKDKTDRFGQAERAGRTAASPSHELPCRCTAARGGRQFGERAQDVLETTHELFLEAGADIVEDDVVTVTNPDGSLVVSKAVVKLSRPVLDGIGVHHVEVQLASQRGATSASDAQPG